MLSTKEIMNDQSLYDGNTLVKIDQGGKVVAGVGGVEVGIGEPVLESHGLTCFFEVFGTALPSLSQTSSLRMDRARLWEATPMKC